MREYLLEELFDLQMGKTPSRNNNDYWDNGTNDWISIRDLSKSGKYIESTKEKLSDIAIEESGIKLIPENTVIMSFKLSIGKVAITKRPMFSNEAIMAFHNKELINILPEYLYYLFLGKEWSAGSNKAVMGITLNKATLSKVKIKLHDFTKQQEIVNILNNCSELIILRKQKLEALDNLIKSRFVEMFGEPIHNSKSLPIIELGKACHMKAGKFIKAADIVIDFETGLYPCFGGNGIRGFVKEYTHEGNIPLIGRQGALCGNVQFATGQFYATEHAIVTQPQNGWNPLWMYIMLREMDLNRLASGAAQPGLNVGTLVPLEVINPDVELQNQYAEFVQNVNKLKLKVEESLNRTEALFDSLMQKYFE